MSKDVTALTRRNVWNLSGVGSEHCAPGAMGKAEDAQNFISGASPDQFKTIYTRRNKTIRDKEQKRLGKITLPRIDLSRADKMVSEND